MGRLVISAQMTADAVMDQNDKWFDPELEPDLWVLDQLRSADALLLGRETYQMFSEFWPKATGELADLINAMPKHVASRTISGPLTWNARLIEGDVAARVAELKNELQGDILSYGFGELAHHLATGGLIDEVRFWLHPAVWGDGLRPVQDGRPPLRMRLIGATTFSSGVVRLSYRPIGAAAAAE